MCESEGSLRVTRAYFKLWREIAVDKDDPIEFSTEIGNLVFPKNHSFTDPKIHGVSQESVRKFYSFDLSLYKLAWAYGRPPYSASRWKDYKVMSRSNVLERLFQHLSNLLIYHLYPILIRKPQKVVHAFPMEEDIQNLVTVWKELGKENPKQLIRLKESLRSLIPGVSDLEVNSAGVTW